MFEFAQSRVHAEDHSHHRRHLLRRANATETSLHSHHSLDSTCSHSFDPSMRAPRSSVHRSLYDHSVARARTRRINIDRSTAYSHTNRTIYGQRSEPGWLDG